MNTTQYFRYENFLVVQNGDYNDTFNLDYLKSDGEFRHLVEYLEHFYYSEHSLQRVSNILAANFKNQKATYKESYGFVELIIPNKKVTINYLSDYTPDLKGRFGFLLNNKFILAVCSVGFMFGSDNDGVLTKDQYCEIIFTSEETRNSLNQIIHSLNTLAKYDAN